MAQHGEAASAGAAVRHYPGCFGCGQGNPRGLGLSVTWDGRCAVAEFTPEVEAEGGPGVVHGGYLAAVSDEVLGLLGACREAVPMMTRSLSIDFRAPVLVGEPLRVRAWVVEERERSLEVCVEGAAGDGDAPAFVAEGVLARVPVRLWLRYALAAQRSGRGVGLTGGDPSTYWRWHLELLKETFDGARLGPALRVVVELADVRPATWTFEATPEGLQVTAGPPGPGARPALRVLATLAAWTTLVHEPSGTLDAVRDGQVEVHGAPADLESFVAALGLRRNA